MSLPALFSSVWLISFAGAPAAAQAPESKPALQCDVGPVTHTYSGSSWLVYSCADNQTVVFATPKDSPAAPFYFMIFVRNGKYEMYGEGPGNKVFTDAAYEDLTKLSANEITALIQETRSAPKPTAH